MDYDKMYEEQKKAGTLRHMRPRQIKLKEGEVIVGKFLGREQFKSKDTKMPDYFVYTFERMDDMVRFPISGNYDKTDGASLIVEGIYAIDYKGKMDIGKGKTFKEVDTIIISEPGETQNGVDEQQE